MFYSTAYDRGASNGLRSGKSGAGSELSSLPRMQQSVLRAMEITSQQIRDGAAMDDISHRMDGFEDEEARDLTFSTQVWK